MGLGDQHNIFILFQLIVFTKKPIFYVFTKNQSLNFWKLQKTTFCASTEILLWYTVHAQGLLGEYWYSLTIHHHFFIRYLIQIAYNGLYLSGGYKWWISMNIKIENNKQFCTPVYSPCFLTGTLSNVHHMVCTFLHILCVDGHIFFVWRCIRFFIWIDAV